MGTWSGCAEGGVGQLGPAVDARGRFAPELASLVGLLRDLTREQWDREAVPGWRVHDLAAHVLGDYCGRLGRGREGFAPVFAPGETLEAFVHRANQEWVDLHADLEPDSLVGELEEAGAEVARRFEATDPDAPALGVSWAGVDPAPAWLDTAREFTEYWTHRQQIRHAVGRGTDTEPRAMSLVLDTFLRALPHTLRATPAPVGTQVAVTVAGPAGGTWTATRTGGGPVEGTWCWSLAEPQCGEPAAGVRLDAESAWRLCTRGIEPEEALAGALVRGERRLAEAACRIVSVVR
ncbi:TIGR03083 family protein [Actinacidiphila yanglinensis]|uniref:TIGR03083 family protein n=1 Tax=Actinacidiphila yanglinensis TaxID=310779 RepID=A0A1H5VR18_9ACTN|nr:maleylpyruvate isomerase family mycothiol-dependent enzyme [Actinacidiphila yanglinensis]SEF88977.1 TIGR03083 family protein [Actinacidiphila yanglinensis]